MLCKQRCQLAFHRERKAASVDSPSVSRPIQGGLTYSRRLPFQSVACIRSVERTPECPTGCPLWRFDLSDPHGILAVRRAAGDVVGLAGGENSTT